MLNQLKVTNAEIVTYNNKYVELSVEDASDNKVALAKEEIHKQLVDLMQLQTTVILSRLDRELLFLKARLKVADDVNKSDLQKRIDGIKSECSIAREQIKKLPVTVKRSVKVKVKNASSGSPATKNVAIEINNEINFNIAELKKFKREHQKKSDIVEMIKLSDRKNRLQQIKDLQKDQADNEVDHYEEIAILQNDEHRYIALQSSACANSSEYKRVVAHLYENSVAQLNLDTATTLLKSRIDGEHVEPVEDNSSRLADAKRMAVNYLDVEIEKLRRDKFASPALFRKSKLAVTLKKLDVLTYLRDQYMRSGFKFEDAQSKLQAKNGELYKFGLAHYRSLYNKVKVLDMAPGLDRGRRIVGEDPASKLSTLPMQDDLIAIVKARRAELVNELSNRVVFTSTKKKKIALLEELNGVMMTMPYQAAMKSVRAKYRDTFDLLFEGRTGEVMKSIEVGSYAKSDIQKMIEVEIDQLSLAKSKSNHFFAKLHNARLQSRIKALEELMNNGFDVTKLNKADKKLLEKHEKNLLADCAAFVEHEVRRAAQVK